MSSGPDTLVHRIADWAQKKPSRAALHSKRNGAWYSVSWKEYWANVRAVGKALIALGVSPGECIAFVGVNDPRFVEYQFGAQAAQAIPAPIYMTNTKEQSAFIVRNAQAKVLVCDDAKNLAKFLEAEKEGLFPRLTAILTFDRVPQADADDRIRSFDEVVALGNAQGDAELDRRLDALTTDATSILIYTSGTTGTPKGVKISHAGQLLIGRAVVAMYPEMAEDGRYHCISYLPLSHQAEQILTNVCSLMTGGEAYFCPDLNQIRDYLVDVRPTVFLGVPRVWEKFEMALRGKLGQATGVKKLLADACMKTEYACFRAQIARGERNYMPLPRKVARKLVVDKVKAALGLDRLEVAITGSAPIAPSTQEFFASLGVTIYEAYGLSETSGVATLTDRVRPRFGTVGRALEGVELRISSEGEIQCRGANNTGGYFQLPNETRELYTEDGWLRTGDLGSLDSEGNLSITGRIKELIITAGGKNVAPVELENHIKSIPGVAHVVVVGDRQPYLCALVTLSPETVGELCRAAGVPLGTIAETSDRPEIKKYLEQQIELVCNSKVARYQTIKKFELLPHEFTVDGGELTATMKLRRNVIADKYADVIRSFYVGAHMTN